jgi:hypothetical protein
MNQLIKNTNRKSNIEGIEEIVKKFPEIKNKEIADKIVQTLLQYICSKEYMDAYTLALKKGRCCSFGLCTLGDCNSKPKYHKDYPHIALAYKLLNITEPKKLLNSMDNKKPIYKILSNFYNIN